MHIDPLEQPEGTSDVPDEDEDEGRKRRRRKKTEEDREVGDDYNLVQPKMKDRSNWIKEYDKSYPDKELMAGAKTIAIKNQILIWQKEAPMDKIIGK